MKQHTFYFMLFAFFFASCANENVTEATVAAVEVPALLERPNIIGPVDEEGLIRQRYNELKAQMEKDPANLRARLSMAELMVQEARISGEHGHYYPAALSLTRGVLELEPDKAVRTRAISDQAAVLLSQHEFAKALELGKEALELNPYNATTYGILVDANVELGRYSEAVRMADKMVQTRPDLRSYSRVSYLREIHGQVDGAIEAMKMAVDAGFPGAENTEWARLTLGKLYQEYGQTENARIQYQAALESRPDYPFAIAALAELDALEGQMEKAMQGMERARTMIPEVGFYIKLAQWSKQMDMPEKYEALTREVFAMLKDDEEAGHHMGLEYAHLYLDLLEKPQKALDYALAEYEMRPDNIFVNQVLAEIYYQLNDLEQARHHLDVALATRIQHPDWLKLNSLVGGYGPLQTKVDQKINAATGQRATALPSD